MTDLQPAHSIEAEKAVLATVLQAPRSLAEVRLILTAADFYQPAHGLLFDTMVELAESRTLDPVLLSSTLASRGLAVRNNTTVLIAELVSDPSVVPDNVGFHANRVRELSRVRRFKEVFSRGMQAVEEIERGYWQEAKQRHRGGQLVDLDRLQTTVAGILLQGELLVDEKLEDMSIRGLSSFAEFLATPDSPQDWLVPDLLEKQDVWMLLAGEGMGKSWLSRQMVLTLGAGIHPLRWDRRIEPVRSLLIDLENADSMVRRQSRGVHSKALQLGDYEALNANTHIWRRQEGLNLRLKPDQLMLEAVIDRVRPKFVAMGSLYNAFRKGNDDWETAAEDVKEVCNRLRARYGFTWWLEHHMPKGDGKDRPQTPYGSSVWQRWVTHGYTMDRVEKNLWQLVPFRGDRDQRDGIPAGLERGGEFPWSPVWSQDDIDARRELAQETSPRRRRAG